MADDAVRAGYAALFGDVCAKAMALLKAELGVFAAEMQGKATQGVNAAVWLMAGALTLLASFALALIGLMFLLVRWGLRPELAGFALAAALAIGGTLALRHGLSKLRQLKLRPDHTLAQLRQDSSVLKRQVGDV